MERSRRVGGRGPILLLAGFLAGCRAPDPAEAPPSEARFRQLIAAGSGPNYAATSDSATDPRLRVRVTALAPAQVRPLLQEAVTRLPRWRMRDSSGAVLWAIRTTRLFRFVDDIYILVEPRDSGAAVLARSGSRVGRGDLGQNRRNLAELWRVLEASLPPPDSGTMRHTHPSTRSR